MPPYSPTTLPQRLGAIVLVAALFSGSGLLVTMVAIPGPFIVPIYVPAGIALAAILLLGRRVWPGIWLGEFFMATWSIREAQADVSMGVFLVSGMAIATGATLQALLGAWFIRRFTGTWYPFTRVAHVAVFAGLAGFVSCLINGTIGPTTLAIAGIIPWANYGAAWLNWWLGDVAGVIIMAPVVLTIAAPLPRQVTLKRIPEFIGLLLLLIILGIPLVLPHGPFAGRVLPMVPLIVWSGLRFGARVTSFIILAITGLTVYSIAHGFGASIFPGTPLSFIVVEIYICTFAITAFMLSASTCEREWAEQQLREANATLETRVLARTDALDAANNALRESETRYAQIAAHMPGIAYQFLYRHADDSYHFTYISDRVEKILGVAAAELYHDADAVYRTMAEADRARVYQAVEDSAQQLSPFDVTYRASNHHERWIHWMSTPTQLPNGDIQWNGVAVDVTEQHQNEDRLRVSEERYRQLFTGMSEGFALHEVILDDAGRPVDYRYLDVNPAFERLTGITREQAIGHTVREILPQIEPYWIETFGGVAITGEPATIEQFAEPLGRYYHAVAYQPQAGQFAAVFFDVTEQRRAQEALRESEERYRLSFEVAPIGIANVAPDGRFLQVNQRFSNIMGYSRDELLARRFQEITHADDLDADLEKLLPVLAGTQEGFAIEKRYLRKDGRVIWAELTVAALRDDAGAIPYLIAAINDITYRKRIEAIIHELNQSTQTGQAFFEQMIWQLCQIIQADIAFIGEYRSPDNGAHIQTKAVCTDGEMTANFSYALSGTPCALIIADGPCVYTQDVASRFPQDAMLKDLSIEGYAGVPLVDSRHQPVGLIVALFRQPIEDPGFVSTVLQIFAARTAAEIERTRAEHALETERALLSTAIEMLPFPIFFKDPHNEIFMTNSALRALRETPDMDAQRMKNGLHLLDPHTLQPLSKEMWPENRALRGDVVPSTELISALPDGKMIPIFVQAAPIYVEGTLVAAVVSFQNIEKLKEADRAKDQFLMVLSHELKTPLTSILGWAKSAREMPEIIPRALDIIIRNAREQQNLLQDLLEVSRIVAGKMQVEVTPVDLWAIARDSVDVHLPMAHERNITLITEEPGSPLPVNADPIRMAQVMGNLLTNALKFTAPGGTIRVRGWREAQWGVLVVEDTGRGIARDQLPLLFRPFTQIERQESTGGLGLGLTIVHGIIDLHGGIITADSPGLGKGSVFTIRLPLRKDTR